jgi:hypothetical protein
MSRANEREKAGAAKTAPTPASRSVCHQHAALFHDSPVLHQTQHIKADLCGRFQMEQQCLKAAGTLTSQCSVAGAQDSQHPTRRVCAASLTHAPPNCRARRCSARRYDGYSPLQPRRAW